MMHETKIDVTPGAQYKHHHSGAIAIICGTATNCNTKQEMVIYQKADKLFVSTFAYLETNYTQIAAAPPKTNYTQIAAAPPKTKVAGYVSEAWRSGA